MQFLNYLDMMHSRLSNVVILNKDFREVISEYDSCDTFFYLDPPYHPSTRTDRTKYEYELTEQDHDDLVNIVSRLKGKVLVSCYDCDVYKSLLDVGFCRREIVTSCNVAARTRNTRFIGTGSISGAQRRVEVLYWNF